MAISPTENRQFVGIIAALAVLAVAAPYFSGTSFAVASNTHDFTVTNIALPSLISKNFGFSVQVTFANLGSVSGSHVVYSYEVTSPYNRVYYNEGSTDLLGGQTKTLVLVIDDEFPTGTYTLKVTADSDKAYTETDETNNAYSVRFTVP